MEEELLKAEEQENSLVKIKDLYKDEIKKLIKKNE
jgi:low affinity Fe/Cu permease